jgi:hypothetical protein
MVGRSVEQIEQLDARLFRMENRVKYMYSSTVHSTSQPLYIVSYLEVFQVGNYQLQSFEGIHDKVCLARNSSLLGTALALVKAFTSALGGQW